MTGFRILAKMLLEAAPYIVAGFLMLFVWVPVLIFGRQADLIYTLIGGYYRWQLRATAYFLLMVDKYPPFSLGEDDPRL